MKASLAQLLSFFALTFLTMVPLHAVDTKPNFVFILADDYGWRDVGIEGSSFYETPNLDRLAKSGMRFTQGYAACQVCSPSRASIQTGKYTPRHGITDWIGAASGTAWNRSDRLLPADYRHELGAEETTIAEALRSNGYRTFFAGKWHLGGAGSLPTDHGYEFNRGGNSTGSPKGGFFSPYENPELPDGPPGESLPLRLAQETNNFIREHRNERFFAFLSFYSVHAPLQTTKTLWQKYQAKASRVDSPKVSERFKIDRTLPVRQIQDHPVYAGMIETMDQAIGTVLETLDQLGLSDNTVVIFTADNGGVSSGDAYATSNLPLRGGKGRQWEGGIREPYYIRCPSASTRGVTCETPVSGIDFYPTILELSGIDPKTPACDGMSLVPLLNGGSLPERALYWHYPHYGNQGGEPSSIIREGSWKLIHYYEDGRDELYDLSQDQAEQENAAQLQPDRVRAMRNKLDRWLKETEAKIPQPDPRFTETAYARKQGKIESETLPQLERQHAGFLKPDFKPNPSWWDSELRRDGKAIRFRKQALTDKYYCDGVNHGDFNRDGVRDVIAGPYWYAGPEFTTRHEIYPAVELPPEKSPSNSMYSYVCDFNEDGWDDVLVLGRVHMHEAYWYENPKGSESAWTKHFAFERVRGESPPFIDVDGDRRPELVCHWDNAWGCLRWNPAAPQEPWRFVPWMPARAEGEWPQFYHGTGMGDINRDGKLDLLLNDGWWEQPAKGETPWSEHRHLFSEDRGGAQMFAMDVDGDGDQDVITALNAHGWGLAWIEQTQSDRQIEFVQHTIMHDREHASADEIVFTQPHALDLADINQDGLMDIVVGKRRWAHGPKGDIEPDGTPLLAWFELNRTDHKAEYRGHLIDSASGVGVQITTIDINGDGRLDVLTASKLGTFVFFQE